MLIMLAANKSSYTVNILSARDIQNMISILLELHYYVYIVFQSIYVSLAFLIYLSNTLLKKSRKYGFIPEMSNMRVSQKVSTTYSLKLIKEQYITHKCITFWNTLPAIQYTWSSIAQDGTYMLSENCFWWATSHIYTAAIHSELLAKWSLLKASPKGQNRWKSNGAKSGVYVGYFKISKCC